MKLYTTTGDDGTTGLFGGGRVSKDHPRVVAYGTVDELNAAVGMARAMIARTIDSKSKQQESRKTLHQLSEILLAIQSLLFDLGADLATPFDTKHEKKIARVPASAVERLEKWIDEIDAENAAMTAFILPGGSEAAASIHLARTVCRRAERLVITLRREDDDGQINAVVPIVLNRLSDLLFAMARRANAAVGIEDVKWEAGG